MSGRERLSRNAGVDILHVAWMAVVLGIVVQLVVLGLKTAGPTLAWIADIAGKVSWSVIVCSALAVVRGLGHAAQGAMGLAGLLGAPLAVEVARVVQKSTSSALGLVDAATPFPFAVVGIRALEYAALGVLLSRLARRADARASDYVARALLVGVVFGGAVALVKGSMAPAALLALAVDELLFPLGCSIALFASERLASRVGSGRAAPAEISSTG